MAVHTQVCLCGKFYYTMKLFTETNNIPLLGIHIVMDTVGLKGGEHKNLPLPHPTSDEIVSFVLTLL